VRAGPRWGCIIIVSLAVVGIVVVGLGFAARSWLMNQGVIDLPFLSGGGQEEPQLGTGAVQVTLRWEGAADLDLHVVDPFGDAIWFNNTQSPSGGLLDVDANADCSELMVNPVENIFWPVGMAPEGEYQVYLVYFRECDSSGPTAYEITAKQDEEVDGRYQGTVEQVGDELYIDSFWR
jgi:uncharacterized protein YfaP (DUF2135 family)